MYSFAILLLLYFYLLNFHEYQRLLLVPTLCKDPEKVRPTPDTNMNFCVTFHIQRKKFSMTLVGIHSWCNKVKKTPIQQIIYMLSYFQKVSYDFFKIKKSSHNLLTLFYVINKFGFEYHIRCQKICRGEIQDLI